MKKNLITIYLIAASTLFNFALYADNSSISITELLQKTLESKNAGQPQSVDDKQYNNKINERERLDKEYTNKIIENKRRDNAYINKQLDNRRLNYQFQNKELENKRLNYKFQNKELENKRINDRIWNREHNR